MESRFYEQYYQWLERIGRLKDVGVFFIVGSPKSGTTWLQKCLDIHPQISSDGEGHFDLFADAFRNLLAAFNQEQKGRIPRARNPLSITFDETDFKNLLKVVMDNQMVKRISGKDIKWVGDKTPEHTKALDLLRELYPNSKILHIIRDGRDCLVSWWSRHKQTVPEAEGLENYIEWFTRNLWVPYVLKARNFGLNNPEDYIEIKYEELHCVPLNTLTTVFEFLGVDSTDETVMKCKEGADFKRLTGGRSMGEEDASSHYRKGIVGDWKNHLDKDLHEKFLETGGDLLKDLGYSV
ncbi:MAG: sulfotransferase [Deltaproteobacteria bacterium]|nr:sulfotransferase [Deltaproteobacteria bacterium]